MRSVADELQNLDLFRSTAHACGYLPGREATSVVVDPAARLSPRAYSALLSQGFRRSGGHVYRPWCGECKKCIPVRIPVADFAPARRQRRVWNKNQGIQSIQLEAGFRDEHYALYRDYTRIRHAGGEMADSSPEEFIRFLTTDWAETVFIELRLDERLVGVAVTDVLPDALSAVYTFFDPGMENRSLGVFGVLQQVELARRQRLDWVYLGYWIEKCRKMSYKTDYRPLEAFWNNSWRRIEPGASVDLD